VHIHSVAKQTHIYVLHICYLNTIVDVLQERSQPVVCLKCMTIFDVPKIDLII